jgi:NitT/TauT family transport system substrate-binding protein
MKKLTIPALIGALLIIAGCGGGGSATTTTAATTAPADASATTEAPSTTEAPIEPVKVRMAAAAPISEFMIPWVGLELGIFEEFGIDLEIELIPGGTQIIAGMAGGSLDAGVFAAPGPHNAVIQGAEMKWVMEWVHKPNLVFVVNESINSVADLKGKAVAISAPGTTTAIFTDKVLREAGLDPQKDIVQLSVGGQGEALAALSSGRVVGAIFGAPVTLAALDTPGAKALLNYTDGYSWPYAGLALTQKFMDEQPEAAVRLLAAMRASVKAFIEDEQTAMAVISRVTNTTDMALVEKAYRLALAIIDEEGIPSVSANQVVLDELLFVNPAAANITVSDVIDDSFIKRALAG